MHFDKTKVVGCIAFQFGNIVRAQARMGHSLTHGHTIGVFLV